MRNLDKINKFKINIIKKSKMCVFLTSSDRG